MASRDYVSNVDCDVALHPDAVLNIVKAFESDPKLSAATGTIEIAPVAVDGRTTPLHLARECEFVEYFSAFRIGRQSQTLMNSVLTLAGAFSFVRREALFNLPQYSNRTVSEDTEISFSLREWFPDAVIACLNQAIAYVERSALSPLSTLKESDANGARLKRPPATPSFLQRIFSG